MPSCKGFLSFFSFFLSRHAPHPKPLKSEWRYAVSTALKIGAPLCLFGTSFHHSRSRFSYFVNLTVHVHDVADFTTSCSSLEQNMATGIARCMNCAFPANDAKDKDLAKTLIFNAGTAPRLETGPQGSSRR